jgi:hypothetical protein
MDLTSVIDQWDVFATRQKEAYFGLMDGPAQDALQAIDAVFLEIEAASKSLLKLKDCLDTFVGIASHNQPKPLVLIAASS